MPVPETIIAVVAPFRPLFTAPTWRKLMTLLAGTLLAHGPRTVCSALRFSGEQDNEHWSGYHHVLNRARWSPLQASRCLLLLIVETLVPKDAVIDLVIDETLERRWGRTISKRGHYRDSLLSSQGQSVSNSGLRWIILSVVVTPPWRRQPMALPFLCVLLTSPAVSQKLHLRHKTVAQRAGQMIRLVHRWVPTRRFCLMGDGAYSCLELGLQASNAHCTLIAPCRLESALYAPLPPLEQRRRGGKLAVKGPRLPSLHQIRHDPFTQWQPSQVNWYGQGKRRIEWCSGTAWWYRIGHRPLPIRWVLVRDPQGGHPLKAFLCTDQTLDPLSIILQFMKRWCQECTFEEARAHLGMETQRHWSDLAIERTTPLLLSLYSLVVLAGCHLQAADMLTIEQTAWYHKSQATFHDVLTCLRQQIWKDWINQTSPFPADGGLLPRSVLDRLLSAVCF